MCEISSWLVPTDTSHISHHTLGLISTLSIFVSIGVPLISPLPLIGSRPQAEAVRHQFILSFLFSPIFPQMVWERERVEREREGEQMSVLDAGDAARAGPAWPRPPHGMLAVRSRDERWWSIRVGRQPGQTSGQPQLILDLNYGFTTSIWSNYRPAASQQQPGNN